MLKPYFIYKYPEHNDLLVYLCSIDSPIITKYLEDNLDKIENLNEILSKSYNLIELIEKYINKIDINLNILCHDASNKKQIELLKNNINKINWKILSLNKNAISILEKNLDKIDWERFCKNENAVDIIRKIIDGDKNYIQYKNNINYKSLCLNKNAIHIIEKILNSDDKDKIDFYDLCNNLNAIDILEKYIDEIGWSILCYALLYDKNNNNYNRVLTLIENNIDKLDHHSWIALMQNEKAIDLLKNNLDKFDINWQILCSNINAIDIIEKNVDNIEWYNLSRNENAIHILEKNVNNINFESLGYNKNAIHILENNIDKIIESYKLSQQLQQQPQYINMTICNVCVELSYNKNTKVIDIIDKLTNNYNIDIKEFFYLPYREEALHLYFKLDYQKMKEENTLFTEELVSYVFNPNRLLKLCETYNLTFEEINDIY